MLTKSLLFSIEISLNETMFSFQSKPVLLFAILGALSAQTASACADDTTYKFALENSPETMVACNWLTKNAKKAAARKSTYCPKVSDKCVKTCDQCCQGFPKEFVEPSLTDITISDKMIWVWEGNPLCTGTVYTDKASCSQVGSAHGVCTLLSKSADAEYRCDSVDTWEISDGNVNYGTLISRGVTGLGSGSVVVGGTVAFSVPVGVVVRSFFVFVFVVCLSIDFCGRTVTQYE